MRALGRSGFLALLAAAQHDAAFAQAQASEAAQTYLSEDYFPGMHLLDVSSDSLVAYRGGQQPNTPEPLGGFAPLAVKMPDSMAEFRKSLERGLEIPEREELQLDWVVYDRQGILIEDLDALRNAELAFVLEIGVWIWPPVRIGFQQVASNVGGKSAVLTTLSTRPKIFEVKNFLADNETQVVMDVGAKQGLVNSKGMMQSKDLAKGTADSEFRTSRQTWLSRGLHPVIGELDERTAELTRVPTSHQEPAQLLRYDEGAYYHNHNDWAELELYPDQKNMWARSHMGYQDRLATVFWYLNDIPEGGETNFPKHGQKICSPLHRGGPSVRHCSGAYDPPANQCKVGLAVKPQKGSVVMWYNFHASGRGDVNSLHAGCPVGKGLVKWSANKWVRIKPGSAMPKWVDGHPALKRLRWKGENAKADPSLCSVEFINGGGEEVEIMWKGGTGQGTSLGSLGSGKSMNMDSHKGHKFFMQSGTRKSNEVTCKPPNTRVKLDANFELNVEGRKEL